MSTRIGINGFGRIGRQVLKAISDRYEDQLEVVAINDLVEPEINANLLKYDSSYGRWGEDVHVTDTGLSIDGRDVRVFSERDPGAIPWGSVGAEVIVESTGFFTEEVVKYTEGAPMELINVSKFRELLRARGLPWPA